MKLIEEINQIIREAHVLIACLLASANMLCAQEQDKSITVETIGIGADAVSAEKNAIYQAVQQAVGAYVDQETKIKNDEVIHDKILSVAQGFVESYQVLEQAKKRKDGSELWDVKIKAVVKKTEVGAALRAQGVMQIHADGTSAWAEMISMVKNQEDGMALLKKIMPEIQKNLILGRIIKNGNEITRIQDEVTGELLTVVEIEYSINIEWWKKEAFPALDAALSAMSLISKPPNTKEFNIQDNRMTAEVEYYPQFLLQPIYLYCTVDQNQMKFIRKEYFLPELLRREIQNLVKENFRIDDYNNLVIFNVEFCNANEEVIFVTGLSSSRANIRGPGIEDAFYHDEGKPDFLPTIKNGTKNGTTSGLVSLSDSSIFMIPAFHSVTKENFESGFNIINKPLVGKFKIKVPPENLKDTKFLKLIPRAIGVKKDGLRSDESRRSGATATPESGKNSNERVEVSQSNASQGSVTVASYQCVITEKDRHNSNGARLDDPVLILMQDRANVYKFGNVEKDSTENFFQDVTHRERIRSYLARGSFPREVSESVQKGNPVRLQIDVIKDKDEKFAIIVQRAE